MRDAWLKRRRQMEERRIRSSPNGIRKGRQLVQLLRVPQVLEVCLRACGLYDRGVRNALDIRLKRLTLEYADLPPAFDGYRILQITDPHIDMQPEVMQRVFDLIEPLDHDLCVLTGDYRRAVSGPFQQIMPAMAELMARVSPPDGVYAVLGNHDCADMAEAFEQLGMTVLVNETQRIDRGRSHIHISGTDDVHCYYTDDARTALMDSPDSFKIALIHSAELADTAAECGYDLYLAGHSHGGQVSLPGGIPVFTQMTRLRRYAVGQWSRGTMVGYTSTGVGTSALPVRFNTRGEVALIELRRA